MKNGSETDVDCGGGTCPACADGLACSTAADCSSGVCTANICTGVSCTDGIKNGTETGLDCGGACPACHLVINEIDYDQLNTDTLEYIEIYNGTGADVSLNGLSLYFLNGSSNPAVVYAPSPISLTSAGTLAAGQFLVVGSPTVTVLPPALKINFGAQDQIQNGAPDGVALVNTIGATLIDALSYEGSITAATIPGLGTVSLVEGNVLPVAVTDDNVSTRSLIRFPDGLDHNNAATDWKVTLTLTPGLPNVLTP
jgi:hypothetical protein